MLDKILCDFLLAGLAEANEFKQVTIYYESRLLGESLPCFLQFTASKINDFAAVGANQVVMMPWSTNCVAVAATSGVYFADKFQLGKYFEGAVDSYGPNMRVMLMHHLIYSSRSKMFPVRSNCLYHYPSLWSEFVAMLLQCSYYISLGKSHFKL